MTGKTCPHCGEKAGCEFWNVRLAIQCGEEGEREKELIRSLTGASGKSRERATILLEEAERRKGNDQSV